VSTTKKTPEQGYSSCCILTMQKQACATYIRLEKIHWVQGSCSMFHKTLGCIYCKSYLFCFGHPANTNGFNVQNQCELENGHPMNLMTIFKNPAIFANLLKTVVYI